MKSRLTSYHFKTTAEAKDRAEQGLLWYLETYDRRQRGEETMTPTYDMPCALDTSWTVDGYNDGQRTLMFSIITAEIVRKREQAPIVPDPGPLRDWLAALANWAG